MKTIKPNQGDARAKALIEGEQRRTEFLVKENNRKQKSRDRADKAFQKKLSASKMHSKKVQKLERDHRTTETGAGQFIQYQINIELLAATANIDQALLGSYFLRLRDDGLINQFSYDDLTKLVTISIKKELEMFFRSGLGQKPDGLGGLNPGEG